MRFRSVVGRGLLAGIGLSMALVMTAAVWGQTPRPDAAALARYVPSADLMFLLEFDGLDAHAAAWKNSAAYKLLNETTLGALIEDLAGQGIDIVQQTGGPGIPLSKGDLIALTKQLARKGFVVGGFGKAPKEVRVVAVARGVNRPEVRRLLGAAAARPGQPGEKAAPVRKAGRELHSLGGGGVWWMEKDDLVLTHEDVSETILAVLDGKQPSAVEHPLRKTLARSANGFEPVARGFLDMAALPPLPPDAAALGLDGLKRIELQWGFQDDALLTVARLAAPSPRRGVLAILDQPTFKLTSLPPLPAGQHAFNVWSVDLGKTYDQIVALRKAADPKGADQVAAFEQQIGAAFGVNLRDDLLRHLGPRLAVYLQAGEPPQAANPLAAMVVPYTGLTVSLQVRDLAAARASLDKVIQGINRVLGAQRFAGGAQPPQFEKQRGPGDKYVLNIPQGVLPEGPAEMFSPTVAIDKDQLVIGATTAAADKALALGAVSARDRWAPTGAFEAMARRLPPEMEMLTVSDPRDTMPLVMESLPQIVQALNTQLARAPRPGGQPGFPLAIQLDPAKLPRDEDLRRLLFPSSTSVTVDGEGVQLVQREPVPSITSPTTSGVLAGLLLPAVQSAREAARRSQCVNNMKQMLLAMHNYHSATNAFPNNIADKDGKPLLSWRVAILPYIEQAELYNKFHLDEPWDSPHNKPLLNEMPMTFQCPSRPRDAAFTTNYRGFSGPGAMFEAKQTLGVADVTDGTSNTLMIVEAKDAVPWTKPDDLPFDPNADPSLFGAGSTHPGGANCAMCDGSVRFLKSSIDVNVFKALITRAGGEAIAGDAF